MVLRLLVGALLGFIIGFERQWRQRAAGLQTSGLVATGSAMFALIVPSLRGDADLRVVANIVTGIGFLAAGVILKEGPTVSGLNTAATLWATAAVGALAGLGLFNEALLGALVILGLNFGVAPLAKAIDSRVEARKKGGNE
jgi:putative Mg2+ transporter-C (MgtC) family protein